MKFSFPQLALSLVIFMQPVHADLARDSEQIMNDAQLAFPQFFPSQQTTLNSPPYLYRFYPSTGIYLGVNQDDLGVYLLGGAFGNAPFYVEQTENVQALLDGELDSKVCDIRSIPDGFSYSQEGNTTFVTTNGQCIAVEQNRNFCNTLPEKNENREPVATNIQVLSENIVSDFEIRGIDFPGISDVFNGLANQKTCIIHAPTELTNHTVNLDICLDISDQLGELSAVPGITLPVTTQFKSISHSTRVNDCFATDAAIITNLVTKEIWTNVNGSFVRK